MSSDDLATQVDATLSAWAEDPQPDWLSPAALRLARRVPSLRPALDRVVKRPLDRALCGLDPVPDPGGSLPERILVGLALADGERSLDPDLARALEVEANGDPAWWVHAARLHVLSSDTRERQARMALSDQDLPYVFPGELHPLMVEALAVGDRVLTSLHVDWMRKLTEWLADALVLDLRQRGLWFWPQLRYLDEKKLAAPLKQMDRLRRGQPGSRGLATGYQARVGLDVRATLPKLEPVDRFVAALAIAADRPA